MLSSIVKYITNGGHELVNIFTINLNTLDTEKIIAYNTCNKGDKMSTREEVLFMVAIETHLRGNCYPPVPYSWHPAINKAVRLGAQEQWDEYVELPDGNHVMVKDLFSTFRLEYLVNFVPGEDKPEEDPE